MRLIEGHGYKWSKSWIDFKAPSAQGVYSLRDGDGRVIFVGKGNIRRRLMSHWYRENSLDGAIWNRGPRTFHFEVTDHPSEREAELIRELKPICRQMSHFKFPKFW